MKKRKYIYVAVLCLTVMSLCMSSGEQASAQEYPEGVELVQFNLHKSVNREVGVPAGIPGYFTYYYAGKQYHYGFRFDKNGKGVESQTFGTAYVQAPYSIIHYDALNGEIPEDGTEKGRAEASTAYLGITTLKNVRGDGKDLGNKADKSRKSARYASDYTIYGNSLDLTEGVMPVPVREGYVFKGWYVEAVNGEVKTDKTAKLAKKKKFREVRDRLNTRVTEQTKILENFKRQDKPAAEITLYAKWEREV